MKSSTLIKKIIFMGADSTKSIKDIKQLQYLVLDTTENNTQISKMILTLSLKECSEEKMTTSRKIINCAPDTDYCSSELR